MIPVGIADIGFGHDDDLVARELFEGPGHVGMAAVGVGGVEEAQAVVMVAVEQKPGEGIVAEADLVGGAAKADGAGSHGQTRGADTGLAEGDLVLGGDLLRKRFEAERGGGGVGGEPGGSEAFGGAAKEVSP